MTKKTGFVLIPDDDGHWKFFAEEFPIETYIDTLAWVQDFWSAFLQRPKILRWIAREAMGKYAFRELYGTKESVEKHGYKIWDWYELDGQKYHKDKIPT